MITRLYVNNFRCLVAFKAEFESFAVLCGPTGAGKSSVFDALRLLQNLGTGDALLGGTGEQDVPALEFTDWLKSSSRIQEFELGLSVDAHAFEYILHIEQTTDAETPRIVREHATCDRKLLFTRDLDGVEFEKADGTMASFPLD
jgi:hypothetical protein